MAKTPKRFNGDYLHEAVLVFPPNCASRDLRWSFDDPRQFKEYDPLWESFPRYMSVREPYERFRNLWWSMRPYITRPEHVGEEKFSGTIEALARNFDFFLNDSDDLNEHLRSMASYAPANAKYLHLETLQWDVDRYFEDVDVMTKYIEEDHPFPLNRVSAEVKELVATEIWPDDFEQFGYTK